MHKAYLVSASIEFKHASLHFILVFASIFHDASLSSLSEFHLTDELIFNESDNSGNQDSSGFRLKKVFWYESWQIEECSLSLECLGLRHTKFFGSKSDSTSSMHIYKILGKMVMLYAILLTIIQTITIIEDLHKTSNIKI